LREGNIGDGE